MTEAIANFHFIRPGWLFLAPLAIGLWWLWQRRTDLLRGWRGQIEPTLLDALVTGQETVKSGPARWLLAAWLTAVIAIAGPTWQPEPNPFADDTTPLIVLLKADFSMETPEPAPNRLEHAKMKITDLAEAWKGRPLGLIAYAGSAHLVLPPTRDTAIVARMAAEVGPDIMPADGDRLDLALREAARVLGEGSQGVRVLVIADLVETEIGLLEPLAKELGLPVHFLLINLPQSRQADSLQTAAQTLGAKVTAFDVAGKDISAIVRHATSDPQGLAGAQDKHWQDAGYWLVPLVALVFLSSFRQEQSRGAVS